MSPLHILLPPTFSVLAGSPPASDIFPGPAPARSLPLSQTRLRTLRSAGNRAVVTLARTVRRSEEDRSLPIVRHWCGSSVPPPGYRDQARADLPLRPARLHAGCREWVCPATQIDAPWLPLLPAA